MKTFSIESNLVDIFNRNIYGAEIGVVDGRIKHITPTDKVYDTYILPGFIDAHVHIESSLLVPSEFARMAVLHGTVATISDPHEIANVVGIKGVEFMLNNAVQVPFHFFFGAPSCVPATMFETAGANLSAADVDSLLARNDIWYLSEMMNFPGVWNGDEEVTKKIKSAFHHGKPVDGHAPGLRGERMIRYFNAGISTDHECFSYEEALEKLQHGVKVIIREGSAARNFNALIPLMKDFSNQLMFCSDDKHPDSLILGHINTLVSRAVASGYDLFDTLKTACVNPVQHYQLPVGLLRVGDVADCIIVSDLREFNVKQTYINGELVADNGNSLIPRVQITPINRFSCSTKREVDFAHKPLPEQPVIECIDGELITHKRVMKAAECIPANDVLKVAVVNRYGDAPIAIGYIRNIGLKEGAIASSVAHDSHNIISAGVDDESICRAVNLIIKQRGGLSAVNTTEARVLPLPVAGLMSVEDAWEVSRLYTELDEMSKQMGSTLRAPFMSLSFMALLVIPHLKMSDKGLFDGDSFSFV